MESVTRFFQDPGSHFFLFGPRGTGKSTWLKQQFPQAIWVDLLAPGEHRLYEARPERLLERLGPGRQTVVIDEIQRIPELLSLIHQLIELRRDTRFVLTGSSSRKLKRSGVDLLGGRALLRRMHPFLASELGDRFDLARALEFGMLPLVWDSPFPRDTLASYLGLYIREEVQAEGLIRNLGAFHRFIEAISFSQAAVINLAEVARQCAVGRKTVEGYLQVLEDLLLCFQLPVFTRRAQRHLVSHPKFFWFDCGVFLAARPLGPLDPPATLAGLCLEGLVAQHLRAWNDLGSAVHSLSYWRTKSGSEVDFILYGPDEFWAIEVKHAQTLHSADTRSLRAFLTDYPEARAMILYRGPHRLDLNGIMALPIEDFLAQLRPGRPLWSES